VVWLPLGFVAVGLGGLGAVLPGLPSTVFFIAAVACFSKSSPRLERWVLSLPGVGPMVDDFRAGRGMPRRAKVTAITMLVISVGLSAWAIGSVWAGAALVAVGAVGVVVILRVPTAPERRPAVADGTVGPAG
jgi:hypothetical protein